MYQDQPKKPGRLSIWLPLLFALVLVAGMLIGMKMQSSSPAIVVENNASPDVVIPGQGKIDCITSLEGAFKLACGRIYLKDRHVLSSLNHHRQNPLFWQCLEGDGGNLSILEDNISPMETTFDTNHSS